MTEGGEKGDTPLWSTRKSEIVCVCCPPPRRLCHPKLVQLYGVSLQKRPLLIVAEFMENGCLLNFLRQRGGGLRQVWLLSMCQDVCEGMEYLEAHKFIHRDLVSHHVWFVVRFNNETSDCKQNTSDTGKSSATDWSFYLLVSSHSLN